MDDAKRANHNALERKRRIHQKERLQILKDAVPELRTGKPSTVDVLLKSADYVTRLRSRHDAHDDEIRALRALNERLVKQLTQAMGGVEIAYPPELTGVLKCIAPGTVHQEGLATHCETFCIVSFFFDLVQSECIIACL